MSNVNTTLTTERLILKPLTGDDAADLFALYSDNETMHFMPTPPHDTLAVTQVHVAFEIMNQSAAHWAIRLRDSDEVIGVVNYLGDTAVPGMGYCLRREHWGKGIVVEACRAAIDYGFDTIGYDRIELWIDRRNSASRRVADKLGFNLNGSLALRYQHQEEAHTMMTYGLCAYEWRSQPAPDDAPSFQSLEPVLLVHDVAASAEYYQQKLGFRLTFVYGDPPNHAGLSYGDWTGAGVNIQLSAVSAERELTTSTYLYINVSSNIDSLHETYADRGVNIIEPLKTEPWGRREFTIRDLNGHVIRFAAPA